MSRLIEIDSQVQQEPEPGGYELFIMFLITCLILRWPILSLPSTQ